MCKRFLLLFLIASIATTNFAEEDDWQLEETNPAYARISIGAEVGGPAIFASALVSIRPFQYLALNGGVGYFGVGEIDTNNTGGGGNLGVFVFPAYLSFLWGLTHSLEILAGADIIVADGSLSGENAGLVSSLTGEKVIPLAGMGYRYAPGDSGFFFRATAYVIFGEEASVTCVNNTCETSRRSSILPWVGITFGYAFFSAEKAAKTDEFEYDDDY